MKMKVFKTNAQDEFEPISAGNSIELPSSLASVDIQFRAAKVCAIYWEYDGKSVLVGGGNGDFVVSVPSFGSLKVETDPKTSLAYSVLTRGARVRVSEGATLTRIKAKRVESAEAMAFRRALRDMQAAHEASLNELVDRVKSVQAKPIEKVYVDDELSKVVADDATVSE